MYRNLIGLLFLISFSARHSLKTIKGGDNGTVKVWGSYTQDKITNVRYIFDAEYSSDIVVSHINYLYNVCETIPPICVVGAYHPESSGRANMGPDLENMILNPMGVLLCYVDQNLSTKSCYEHTGNHQRKPSNDACACK